MLVSVWRGGTMHALPAGQLVGLKHIMDRQDVFQANEIQNSLRTIHHELNTMLPTCLQCSLLVYNAPCLSTMLPTTCPCVGMDPERWHQAMLVEQLVCIAFVILAILALQLYMW